MSVNRGKQFETKFKEDFLRLGECTCDRLIDVTLGYKSIKNVADFICYKYPTIYYIECKSHKGASIPMENITQYDNLAKKVGLHGVRSGVVLWLVEKDIVMYIPTSTITKLKTDGEKSIGIRHLGKYNIKVIPSVKKRVFLDSDYTILTALVDGE